MIVAIDGPAGSGKSTVAHAIAERCDLTFLDTGAMYRAVTVHCLAQGIDVSDADAVTRAAQACAISFGRAEDGTQTVQLDGADVTQAIRTPEVDANVSAVAAVPAVREEMVRQQRELAAASATGVVAEGRDIGTVVFPQAQVKVFLTASAEARARRRAVQRAGGDEATGSQANASEEEVRAVLEAIEKRDAADSSREVAPLKPADDAVLVDSSELTLEQVVARVEELVVAARQAEAPVEEPVAAEEPASVVAPASVVVPASAEEPVLAEEPAPAVAVDVQDASAQPVEAAQPQKAPEPEAKPKDAKPKEPKPKDADAPLKLWGNEREDYFRTGMRDYPAPVRGMYHALLGAVGGLSKLVFRWRIENAEEADAYLREHGCVIVMNHCSLMDPVVMLVHLWSHGIRVRPVYKSEFESNGFLHWVFPKIGALPVERGTADMKMVRWCRAALKRGESILIYPEGTRVRSDDEQVEIHGGFALLAHTAKAPVIPCAIVGSRNIKPVGAKFPRPSKLYVRFGEPIEFADLGVRGRKEQVKAMEERAMAAVWELRSKLRIDHPGKL